ncbi:MAG: DNA translocase FtsK 4TM domain-containing protein [Bdellovibrionota bacterium]
MENPPVDSLRREALGVVAVIASIVLLLALLSLSPSDEGLLGRGLPVGNWIGAAGVWLSNKFLFELFGFSAYFVPLGLFALGGKLFLGKELPDRTFWVKRGLPFLALWLFFAAALHQSVGAITWDSVDVATGGLAGTLLARGLRSWFNTVGAAVVTLLILLVSFMAVTRISIRAVALRVWEMLLPVREWVKTQIEAARTRAAYEEREEHVAQVRAQIEAAHVQEEPEIAPPPPPTEVAVGDKIREIKKKKKEPKQGVVIKEQERFEFAKAPDEPERPAQLPGRDLLDFEPSVNQAVDQEQLKANAKILEKKLLDFGIQGQVVAIEPGPVITTYEFRPAPGVKVSKIANLQDDLAMALSAVSIRIIAPIPGKDVVGIEIPNKHRQRIFLKELLENEEFVSGKSKTPLALGKDTVGRPFYWDLQKMPHLLIAGSTGAGKSVGLNTMILSILYKALSNDVKLILIDPKRLELSVYEGIPHLYASVVTDPRKAASALRWSVTEMERRYKLLADYGVRNLEGYNRAVERELSDGSWKERAKKRAEEERRRKLAEGGETAAEAADPRQADLPLEPPEVLPLLIVVIDELADLMMIVGKDVEESVTRLAQMARASGIHLIMATQRPSVDVLTGLIKANFPARVSFQVRSYNDSRTILDQAGAEQLLGQGDMLFLPPNSSKLVRIHGAFVSDEEVHRVVEFLKSTGQATYHDQILDVPPDLQENPGPDDEPPDPLYEQAVRVVIESAQASTSYVQRRLKIGYNRAARMIERMERDGIVGPSDGVRPREILVTMLQAESLFASASAPAA